MESQTPLLPHQQVAKDFILTHPYCSLFLNMGLGKTRTTLDAMDDINPNHHILIIAPKNIARSTWVEEIEKWNYPFRYKSLIVNERGNKLTRKKRLALYKSIPNEPPTVWFINRDLVVDLIENMPTFYDKVLNRISPVWYFPTVIIDEIQSFKSYDSDRFQALQKVRPYIERLIGLTGTPMPKGIEDLWAETWLLDMGYRLGDCITRFRERFETPKVPGKKMGWKPIPGAEQEIFRLISDLVISMKNSSMYIPPINLNFIPLYLDDNEMNMYKRFKEDLVLEIDGEEITAANAAVLAGRLQQMASGALYKESGSHEFFKIHEKKLEATEYIINNTDDNVMVAYHYYSDLKMLKDYLTKLKIPFEQFDGSPKMKKRWNEGKIKVLLVQPASSGHGLNLQDGGHTLIWYTLPQSLEEYKQCIKRLNRQGAIYPTMVHHLMVQGTYDLRSWANIERKDTSQEALIDSVKCELYETLETNVSANGVQIMSDIDTTAILADLTSELDIDNNYVTPVPPNTYEVTPSYPAQPTYAIQSPDGMDYSQNGISSPDNLAIVPSPPAIQDAQNIIETAIQAIASATDEDKILQIKQVLDDYKNAQIKTLEAIKRIIDT
jgi:SNF2 family DNA or RNA helicase